MAAARASRPRPPRPATDEDKKAALLAEYDAASVRDRPEILDREGVSRVDISRWRREAASRVAAETGSVPPEAAPDQPDTTSERTALPGDLAAEHASAVMHHASALSRLIDEAPGDAALTDLLAKISDYSTLTAAVELLARQLSSVEPPLLRASQVGADRRRPWWGG